MAVRFADRMGKVEGSAIRELLKLTARPEVISFAGGMPAPELFPVEEMKKVSVAVLEEQGKVALHYNRRISSIERKNSAKNEQNT